MITKLDKPNKLTFWAAKNIKVAVCLIVLIEISKFFIGFYLGNKALPAYSANSLSVAALLLSACIFVVQNFFQQKIEAAPAKAAFGIIARGNLLLFTASFLLSVLAGNQWKNIENPRLNINLSATLSTEKTTQINADSILTTVQKEQQAHSETAVQTIQDVKPTDPENDDLQRLGYFALFVLGMALTFLGLALTCGLACGGYGIYAALIFLINIGIFGGGIYFLLKVFQKGRIKKWREMDTAARRKEGKKFLLTTLVSFAVAALFLLIASNF